MRVSEIREREDFDGIMRSTLERAWTQVSKTPVSVSLEPRAGAQVWLLNPVLSAFHTIDAHPAARRFLADSVRYTPRRWRAPAQWLVGTLAASSRAMRRLGRPFLWVTPPVDAAENVVVSPGNQRVRLFDFSTATTRVALKTGFDARSMHMEINLRSERAGPFPPILAAGGDASWFEERIMDGFSLTRTPPWHDRRRYLASAFAALASWLDRTTRPTVASAYADELAETAATLSAKLAGRGRSRALDRVISHLAPLARAAATASEFATARSHGDFQLGNIFVQTRPARVCLIDWEYSRRRQASYDGLVLSMSARFPPGLAKRLARFLDRGIEGRGAVLVRASKHRSQRLATVAVFLLEELRWHLEQNAAGPFSRLTPNLLRFIHEFAMMAPNLSGARSIL